MIDPTRWRHLVADMPLVVLDTETTDADAAECGVCEFAAILFDAAAIEAAIAACVPPQDERGVWQVVLPAPTFETTTRLHPGRPISPGATAVHGIRDEDVAACPGIDAIAGMLGGVAAGHRVAGYNSGRFDLPVLGRLTSVAFPNALDIMGVVAAARMLPAPAGKLPWDLGGAAQMLGLANFKNKLGAVHAALRGRQFEGAHGALADCRAGADVLFALLAIYPDLPAAGPALAAAAARALCMVQPVAGVPTFTVGKHEGVSVANVEMSDAGYIGWLLDADDMDEATKNAVIEVIGEARATQILQSRRAPKPGRGRKPKGAQGVAA